MNRLVFALLILGVFSGCAAVKVRHASNEWPVQHPGSVGALSLDARSVLSTLGLAGDLCARQPAPCIEAVSKAEPLSKEPRFATLAELSLVQARGLDHAPSGRRRDEAVAAYLEVARFSYAYLFHGELTPSQRALESRQGQVRDYYDTSMERIAVLMFARERERNRTARLIQQGEVRTVGNWSLSMDRMELRLPAGVTHLDELVPTSGMDIEGMRNVYRRDGLGATLVAVALPSQDEGGAQVLTGESIGYLPATLLVQFPTSSLEELLSTRRAGIQILDPYRTKFVSLDGVPVPLSANYTAPYALWLARSGFGRQSLAAVLGRSKKVDRVQVFMMQPYDPSRLTIVMLHGLASSPEAWVNMANEILGDEALRDRYQVWQVYYPTNLPLAINREHIRQALARASMQVSPEGREPMQNTVLIGHSMGGVLSRLLVLDSADYVWDTYFDAPAGSEKRAKLAALNPYVSFKPLTGVSRAIFLASPHAGTPYSGSIVARLVSSLVRLPASFLGQAHEMADLISPDMGEIATFLRGSPNAINALNSTSPYLKITSTLDISQSVSYHSIIGRKDPAVALLSSDDGYVPYASAHLPDAQSELVLTSGHSVQENPAAILEIRRILRLHANIGEQALDVGVR